MDDHSSDEDEDDNDDVNDLASDMASSVSSVSSQQRDGSSLGLAGMQVRTSLSDTESDVDSVMSEQRHPLSALDENNAESDAERYDYMIIFLRYHLVSSKLSFSRSSRMPPVPHVMVTLSYSLLVFLCTTPSISVISYLPMHGLFS
jgi:hypothetical protein